MDGNRRSNQENKASDETERRQDTDDTGVDKRRKERKNKTRSDLEDRVQESNHGEVRTGWDFRTEFKKILPTGLKHEPAVVFTYVQPTRRSILQYKKELIDSEGRSLDSLHW